VAGATLSRAWPAPTRPYSHITVQPRARSECSLRGHRRCCRLSNIFIISDLCGPTLSWVVLRLLERGCYNLINYSPLAVKTVYIMTSPKIWSETTPRRYISGLVALNLPTSPDSGDWHTMETLRALKRGARIPLCLAGESTEFDAFDHFGNEGIIDASTAIARLGEDVQGPVYVATHARAVADMLMSRLPQGRRNLAHLNLDAWLSEDGKDQVIHLLMKARYRFSDEQVAILERLLGRRLGTGGVDEAA